MFGFHWVELLLVLGLAVLIFGPKRLPEIGGAFGRGLRDFRRGVHDVKDEMGISEIQEQVRDVRDTVRSLPRELEVSTRPVEPAQAGLGSSPNQSN